jgi:hypothetical protein
MRLLGCGSVEALDRTFVEAPPDWEVGAAVRA